MTKATAPIDLLREFRAAFEAEAAAHRAQQNSLVSAGLGDSGKGTAVAGKAYAAEQAVKKIDATLRDWA